MDAEADAPDLSDDAFLDRQFERALVLFQDGSSLDVAHLLGGREHLRAEVEALVQTARLATGARTDELPRVRGYTLLGEIGRGGMGAVYLARQEALGGRRVALKVLPASPALTARARERFLSEARALAALRHPHVVVVHDVVSEGGVLAYAMEWVEGASLAQLLRACEMRRVSATAEDSRTGPSPADVRALLGEEAAVAAKTYAAFVCRIGIAVARALGELHRAGLVHRDVKPSNILLRRDGTPLLSDFGLVHAADGELTQSGHFAGTIAYASPEQLAGDPESLDSRSDVYSLGVTIYHALSLHLPFDDRRGRRSRPSTPTGMLRRIEGGRAVPLRAWNRRLPRDLETILAKALETEPSRRYASTDELADDLERVLGLQPIRARRAGWLARALKLVRRNRATALGVGLGSVATLALAIVVVVHTFLAPRWVEEHTREARLALLDPTQANVVFVREIFGAPGPAEPSPLQSGRALADALAHYDAALRWAPFDAALRAERDAVSSVRLDGEATARPADALGEREAALIAFLRGDVDGAIRRWEAFEASRDPTAAPDPLVEAALGISYLVRERAALAYPRLREACRALPGVGFLVTYLADSAVRCGDLDVAERLLTAARGMQRPDPIRGADRVLADLRAAQGRDLEAETLYRTFGADMPGLLSYARFLELRGRRDESIVAYVQATTVLRGANVQRECASALDGWWTELTAAERGRRIRDCVRENPDDFASLVGRLRARAAVEDSVDPPLRPTSGAPAPAPEIDGDSSPLALRVSSPPLQNRSLTDLARTLEVQDMARWKLLRSYSPLFQSLYVAAWRSPAPSRTASAIDALAHALRLRVPGLVLGAATLASVGSVTSAQNCPNAPCFQGLGDLPGGTYLSNPTCLSSDGTTVGGISFSAAGDEGFVWTYAGGMVGVGDLPGNAYSSIVRGLSADGSVATGHSSSGTSTFPPYTEAFRWTQAGGLVALGDLPGGVHRSEAYGISDDGLTVSGFGYPGSSPQSARWTSATSWVPVGPINGLFESASRDGQWGCGYEVSGGVQRATRWSDFLGWQIVPGVSEPATALAIADDGTVVVIGNWGSPTNPSYVWSGAGSPVQLPDLAGGAVSCGAVGIMRDGSWILGSSQSTAGDEAVLWDESRSVHRIVDVLTGAGVTIPAGWVLQSARTAVRNGSVVTVCGYGLNPSGQTEAWVAKFEGYPTELFCFGDGTGTPCPCGNHSPVGSDDGCLNSLGVGGRLRVTGTADITSDTLVLQGSQMPNSFALYFQGSTLSGGGNGTVFGDGLRCAGSIIRLGTKANAGGASVYPEPGDQSVSVRGMVTAPGGWRFYQTWYRNAAAFCSASTFNLTNAARVFWVN